MRRYIDILNKLNESEVIRFPGNPKPTNNMAVVHGGADVVGFPEKVNIDSFQRAYITAALWSSTDNANESGGEPLDKNYDISDIVTPTLKQMAEDCDDFRRSNEELLNQAYDINGYDDEQAGHDFWLTRNHHGAGFWDRGLGTVGQKLADAAHAYGEYELYIGDDGMIHGQ